MQFCNFYDYQQQPTLLAESLRSKTSSFPTYLGKIEARYMLAGLHKVRQQWTVQNRSVKRPKHQRFWENSSQQFQLMLVLPLIPFFRASIPTLPARSLSEINFTASKLKDQVPTTTAILTVRLIMDWKLALSPITGPKDFQVTSQKSQGLLRFYFRLEKIS